MEQPIRQISPFDTGSGTVVHREGFFKNGLQFVVEIRIAGQDGDVVVAVVAYVWDWTNNGRAQHTDCLLHARAADVAACLEVKSLRPMTHWWWCEMDRIPLWKKMLESVDVVDGTVVLNFEAEPDEFTEELLLARRLAPILSLQEHESNDNFDVEFFDHGSIEENCGEDWEEESAHRTPEAPLSVRVCGREEFVAKCPGTVAVGIMGMGGILMYDGDIERTQAAAMYVRDPALSSTNSVLVTVLLALDTPALVPLLMAWITRSALPPPVHYPWPPSQMIIPRFLIPPDNLVDNPVESILDTMEAAGCVIQCDVEDPLDYLEDKLKAKIEGHVIKHRRLWDEHDKNFFRQWLKKRRFVPDPVVSPRVFGVTNRGAVANAPGTNKRHNWHSEQRCVESLSERRTEKDYVYIAGRRHHQGANDPNTYRCLMQHELLRELEGSRLSAYLLMHRQRREAARIKQEQDALKAKIEAGKAALAAKRKEQERIEHQLNAKEAIRQRKRKGKNKGKGNSPQEWALRVQKSTLIREWEGWQERRDEETQVLFYHSSDEALPEPSMWDPPDGWPHNVEEEEEEDIELSDDETEQASDEESEDPGDEDQQRGVLDQNSGMPNTIEGLIDSLAKNQDFLETLSIKLGMISKQHMQEEETDSDEDLSSGSDEEGSGDEEGGRSHQQGAGALQGGLQRHHGDRRQQKLQDGRDAAASGNQLPPLALDRMRANRGKGWRRLKKSTTQGLVQKATSTHTLPSKGHMTNTPNQPSLVGMVDPVEGASYELPEQVVPVEVVLLKDIMADTERLLKEQARLLGTTEEELVQDAEDGRSAEEKKLDWAQKAISMVKNGKLSELEEALDEDVNVDTTDEHGNSLIHLAVQQGNKRITKFLLRRGAKVNTQNLQGNSLLHYAYEYNFEELAEYLKGKGCDDSLLNAQGLTCYEGLNRSEVDGI